VVQALDAGAQGRDVVPRPPGADFRAGVVEALGELVEGGIAGLARGGGAAAGEQRGSLGVPVDEDLTGGRVGERPRQPVALGCG
jgi:hypothetical protein